MARATAPRVADGELAHNEGEQKTIEVLLCSLPGIVPATLGGFISAQDDMQVTVAVEDPSEVVRYAAGHKPDVVLMEAVTRAAVSFAKDTAIALKERVPGAHVVILTLLEDPVVVRDVLRDGALGYVLRSDQPEQLLTAIRSAAAGEPYLSPDVAMTMAGLTQKLGNSELSERETEVLRLVGLGHTNPEIAQSMHLSVRTVETHRAHLHDKLGAVSRADLVRNAIDRGLVV